MLSFFIAIIMIIIDQAIKYTILVNFNQFDQIEIIKNFFNITYVKNYGIAFGLFANKTIFFIIMTATIIIVIIYLIAKTKNSNRLLSICLGLILGGAIGNLIDRVRLGYVVDYLQFSIFPPVFNFADSCIVVGAIALSLVILFDKSISI